VIIETDGKKQLNVFIVDYWTPRHFKMLEVNDAAKTRIMAVAEKVLKNLDSRNLVLFQRKYTELSKRPDCFGGKHYFTHEAKTLKQTNRLFKVLNEGKLSPWEFTRLTAFILTGRTGFKASRAFYDFSVSQGGKTKNFTLGICIVLDLYQNKSAGWEFYNLGFWEKKNKK